MRKGILICVIWLVVINLFAVFALNRVNLRPDDAYAWINPSDFKQEKTWNPVALHTNWDAYWYLSIVKEGYQYTPHTLSNVAFFPLYPAAIKLFSLIVTNVELSGWIISSASLVLACGALYLLTKRYHRTASATNSVVYLLLFPTAFF